MGTCKCGFSRDIEKNCDGTHKVVKEVRNQIAKDISAIEIEDSITNAVGMKIMAMNTALGQK